MKKLLVIIMLFSAFSILAFERNNLSRCIITSFEKTMVPRNIYGSKINYFNTYYNENNEIETVGYHTYFTLSYGDIKKEYPTFEAAELEARYLSAEGKCIYILKDETIQLEDYSIKATSIVGNFNSGINICFIGNINKAKAMIQEIYVRECYRDQLEINEQVYIENATIEAIMYNSWGQYSYIKVISKCSEELEELADLGRRFNNKTIQLDNFGYLWSSEK